MDSRALNAVVNRADIEDRVEGIATFWLGIDDKDVEGTFLYSSSNTPITLTNWAPGKPDGFGDCVHILANGQWNDGDCNDSAGIVCESK